MVTGDTAPNGIGAASRVPDVPDVSPVAPSRPWRVLLALIARLPQATLSRAFGMLADVPIPRPLRRPLLGTFCRAAGIDLSQAERPLTAYRSLDALFVRRLRPGARVWPSDPRVVGSPVDGVIGEAGRIVDGRLVQAKGHRYPAAALVADAELAERFRGGTFLTLYLAPRHYHRVHTPCAGRIDRATYVPGGLMPVNSAAVAHVAGLFVRNERLVCSLDGPVGRVVVVAVGAYNVGRITVAFDPGWGTRAGRAVSGRRGAVSVRRYDPPRTVGIGDEMLAFHLGSTVILLFEPEHVRLRDDLRVGLEVRVGEPIAFPPTD